MKVIGKMVMLLFALGSGQNASAQAVIPPGMLTIDGFPMVCGPAPTYLTGMELGDTAKATPSGIYLNVPAMSALPTGVKLFVYAHECGHMLYGNNENVADKFGIQIGRSQGWIDLGVLHQICGSLYFSPGDWTHLPGPARCNAMIAYFHSF